MGRYNLTLRGIPIIYNYSYIGYMNTYKLMYHWLVTRNSKHALWLIIWIKATSSIQREIHKLHFFITYLKYITEWLNNSPKFIENLVGYLVIKGNSFFFNWQKANQVIHNK